MIECACLCQIKRAKTPGVIEHRQPPARCLNDKMVMLAVFTSVDHPAARHTEVKDQHIVAVGIDQAVFGAAAKPGDRRPGQPLSQVDRHGPTQVSAIGLRTLYRLAIKHGAKSGDGGFYFG